MTPADDRLHDALRALPAPRAPHTLLARVLAATVEAAPRPWYTRVWAAWPLEWQLASAIACAGLVGAWLLLAPYADPAFAGVAEVVGAAADRARHLLQGAEVVAAVAQVLWRSLVLPAAVAGFAIALVAALAGSACWTTINRLAFHGGEGTHR